MTTLYVCLYIAFLFLAAFLWLKCNGLAAVPKKAVLLFFVGVLGLYLAVFVPAASPSTVDSVCSAVPLGSDAQQLQLASDYFAEMRSRLPRDNGTFVNMFFKEHVQKLSDDFSAFLSTHSAAYVGFFSKYILGAVLCLALLLANQLRTAKAAEPHSCGQRTEIVLKWIKRALLIAMLLVSLLTLSKSLALNDSVKKSVCFLTSIPHYFSRERDAVPAVASTKQLAAEGRLGALEPLGQSSDGAETLNYIEFFDLMHS